MVPQFWPGWTSTFLALTEANLRLGYDTEVVP